MVTVTARVDMIVRTVGGAMVPGRALGGGIVGESSGPGWDMDGSRGQQWNARSGLRSRVVSLIGRRASILERLEQLAWGGGGGLEDRIEWPVAMTVARSGLTVAPRFLLRGGWYCPRCGYAGAGFPDGAPYWRACCSDWSVIGAGAGHRVSAVSFGPDVL